MNVSDLGLFGPESVTWRVHADPALWFGGLRALFLQALHPVAMAGVAAHSDYRGDPWGRLMRTADYVGVTTYGTTEDAGRAAARVRRIHAKLTAVDPDTGAVRRVDDPDLLLWVHCCEVESFLDTVRRAGMRINAAQADRYVAEQVSAARLVGLDPDRVEVPHDTAGLAAYFDQIRPVLRTTAPTYDALRFLAAPPMAWWVRYATPALPSWIGVVGLGFALLPRWARRLYTHAPALPTTDLGATVALRTVRTALLALPAVVREGPHHRAAKERTAAVPVRRLDVLPA
ncbi:MAG TPA: oxygenase MpaB family protein [Cryptosporangiaceae bacterium]|nr:oxygenase MpaB family protein [Cryptosporangiaceae bacterium]